MRVIIFTILSTLLFLCSCSIQKRNYRPGYHVEWKNSSTKTHTHNFLSKKSSAIESLPIRETILTQNKKQTQLLAAASTDVPKVIYTGTKTFSDNCDSLFLRKGEIILAKVKEINPTEIKYKKCGAEDGPLYVIAKNDVHYIIYANGQTEEFKIESNFKAKTVETKLNELQIKRDAEASLLYSIVGVLGLFLGGLGLIFLWFGIRTGRRALKAIRGDVKMMRQFRTKAIVGFTISLIVYLLVALLITFFVTYWIGSGLGLLFGAIFGLVLFFAFI